MVILIAVIAILLTIIVALLLSAAVKGLDNAVIKSSAEYEAETRAYNPALTMGHQIQVSGDKETQYKEARKLAAKQAAATPRGANVQIGPQHKKARQATAYSGVESDPITAVKIASYHGWDGLRTGIVAIDPAAAAAPAASAASGRIRLVPGKDYPVIEIKDGMTPDEKRKARIANAKAKSTAMKAAKAAQQSGAAVPTAAAPAPAAAAAVAPTAAVPVPAAAAGIPEPEYVEITEGMSPEDKRKARIANAKAKSAYKKALKAAGVDVNAVAAPAAVPQPAAPAAAAAPAADAAVGIPKPDLIEITEAMSPDEKRKARIANAKAKSAYNKALKAAGIDPKSVK